VSHAPNPTLEKRRGLALCAVAYASAWAAAASTVAAWPSLSPLLRVAVADVVATVVIFVWSRALSNSSMYDAYWSVAPIPMVAFWALHPVSSATDALRSTLVVALVTVWGVRLTYNWARGWTGLSHEDWRYGMLREKTGAAFPLVDFFGIHLFPTVQVFAGCLGAYVAVSEADAPFSLLDGVAVLVTAAAIGIEAVADRQLHDFARTKKPGEILKRGLWAHSRHPNYFGECLFWWGLYLFSVAARPELWWTVLGPSMITAMFVFVSIPMIDARSLERRPEYAEHVEKVSALVPWFPKR